MTHVCKPNRYAFVRKPIGSKSCPVQAAVAIKPSLPVAVSENGSFREFRGGDFCRNGLRVRHFGSAKTGTELQKSANSGLFCSLVGDTSDLGTAWLS